MNLKEVKKLGEKKYRKETGLFYVEGRKNILELLDADFVVDTIFTTEAFYPDVVAHIERKGQPIVVSVTSEESLQKAGTFVTNVDGIAVAQQRPETRIDTLAKHGQNEILLVLDGIQDPGNLGTIIRTADWFGITTIIASPSTVDFYNPKVITGTMGSFTRVAVHYLELLPFLTEAAEHKIPSYGAVLTGENIFAYKPVTSGIIVLGSESHGIDNEILAHITTKLTIPKYGHAESLNVGIATGIVLSCLARR